MSTPIWPFGRQTSRYPCPPSLPSTITFPKKWQNLLLRVGMCFWETSTYVSIATTGFIQQICPSTTLFRDRWVGRCHGKMPWLVARNATVGRDPHRCRKSVTRGWNWIVNQDVLPRWNWRHFRVGWYRNESIRHGNHILAFRNARQQLLPTPLAAKRRETKNLLTIDTSNKKQNKGRTEQNRTKTFLERLLGVVCLQWYLFL